MQEIAASVGSTSVHSVFMTSDMNQSSNIRRTTTMIQPQLCKYASKTQLLHWAISWDICCCRRSSFKNQLSVLIERKPTAYVMVCGLVVHADLSYISPLFYRGRNQRQSAAGADSHYNKRWLCHPAVYHRSTSSRHDAPQFAPPCNRLVSPVRCLWTTPSGQRRFSCQIPSSL